MPTAWIALGSNLEDPPRQLRAALRRIGDIPGVALRAQSSLYRSAPLGPAGQPDYCNAVCAIATSLEPLALLRALQQIEDERGRIRTTEKWGPRVLDLDLLLYDALVLASPALTLPHPELHRRNFVLAPLAELDAGLVVPGKGDVGALLRSIGREGLTAWSE
jgi:2-amino-4-hydroxy-6-hydroxymethyldihydropteridine diphosphokinase